MRKIKIRKILLLISIVTLIILAVILYFGFNDFYKYKKEGYDYLEKIKGDALKNDNLILKPIEPNKIASVYTWPIMVLIFNGFFILFGLIYTFSKKNPAHSLRKWPHIILIIFASISILLFVWFNFTNHFSKVKVTGQSGTIVGNSIIKTYDEKLKALFNNGHTLYKATLIIAPIMFAILLGLSISQLVFISADKKGADIDYSKKVKATGEAIKTKESLKANTSKTPNNLP